MVSIRTVARMVPRGIAQRVLREVEDIVPQPGFEMAFQLGQVEIRPTALPHKRLGVVEEVQTEIEERPRDLGSVNQKMLFVQVPTARADQQRRDLLVQAVALAFRAVEGDGAADGIAQIDLAVEVVGPGGRVGILEIGHEDAGAGVERVDDHLAVHGAGDLDAAVQEVLGDGRDSPFFLADGGGLGEEVRQCAGVDFFLANLAAREEVLAAGFEGAGESGEKVGGFAGDYLGVTAFDGTEDLSLAFRDCRLLGGHNLHGRSMIWLVDRDWSESDDWPRRTGGF